VVGDNGRATFMLGELREVKTTDSMYGGRDTINSGNGRDLVFGGSGDDTIDAGVKGSYENGDIRVISLNFGSDAPEAYVTGVAGAVQAGNWNNLVGGGPALFGDIPDEQIFLNDGSAADGVTIQWGRRLDHADLHPLATETGSYEPTYNPGTQNEKLFQGFLQADTESTLGVNLKGLKSSGKPYDVYVYLDPNASDSAWTDFQITGEWDSVDADGKTVVVTRTFYLADADGTAFAGEFVEVSAMGQKGNYVVFRNLESDNVSLRVKVDRSIPHIQSDCPGIAAIQIVAGRDKDAVQIGGDIERDIVLGDNGVGHLFGGLVYEVRSTNLLVGGRDRIRGGDGTDLVIGGTGSDALYGDEGHDVLLGDNGRFTLFDERVIGLDFGLFNDDCDEDIHPYDIPGILLLGKLFGGHDVLSGGPGDDLLYGQSGNDTYAFAGSGLGRDRLVEVGGIDNLLNDPGDRLYFARFEQEVWVDLGESQPQVINAGTYFGEINLVLSLFSDSAFEGVVGSQHGDFIDGNARHNVLDGQGGNDVILGRDGQDWIYGGDGNDAITAGTGDDWVYGQADNDTVLGGSGDDRMDGGWGDDLLLGEEGDDVIWGGVGKDLIFGNDGDDHIFGGASSDEAWGGNGNDRIFGDAGDDRLYGGKDDDIIEGGQGNDYLHGDDDNMWFSEYGHDCLAGGAGDDVIQGGGGTNIARFHAGFAVSLNESGHGTASDGQGGTDELWNISETADVPCDGKLAGNSQSITIDSERDSTPVDDQCGKETHDAGELWDELPTIEDVTGGLNDGSSPDD
jgi:Ca2+-binding RTX toxin-like protein